MVQRISSLSWVPMGANNSKRVAFISLLAATDTNWRIQLQGTATGDNDAENIRPVWLQIDNLANNALIAVTFGSVVFQVQPYSRQNFPIDAGMQYADVSIPSGTAALWLSETRLAEDASNSVAAGQAANAALLAAIEALTVEMQNNTLAIQQMDTDLSNAIADMKNTLNASIATLTTATNNVLAATNTLISITNPARPYILVSAGRAQVAGDNLKALVFTGGGTYSLLSAAVAGAGFSFDVANEGSANVTITPIAGQTINGVFTNGSPLTFRPDSYGTIYSDGTNWVFKGRLLFTDTVVVSGTGWASSIAQSVTTTTAHGFGKRPTGFISCNWRCITAQAPWGVGNLVDISKFDLGNAGNFAYGLQSATNLSYTVSWTALASHTLARTNGANVNVNIGTAGSTAWTLDTTFYCDW